MLEARGIGFRLLKEISLELRPGEVVAVLGQNGAGKSTLLKVLSGEWKPTAGSVWMNGKVLSSWSSRERARAMAVLPQNSQLAASFTGLEVVRIGRTAWSPSPNESKIALAALRRMEASHLSDRVYTTPSGGEQQRVQMARVLAQIWEEPARSDRYLLLDEPTANLDLSQQHRTLKTARAMAGEGIGILAVMHDLNLAAQHADRLMLLRDGEVSAFGAPAEVITEDIIAATFSCRVDVFPHPYRKLPLVFPSERNGL